MERYEVAINRECRILVTVRWQYCVCNHSTLIISIYKTVRVTSSMLQTVANGARFVCAIRPTSALLEGFCIPSFICMFIVFVDVAGKDIAKLKTTF